MSDVTALLHMRPSIMRTEMLTCFDMPFALAFSIPYMLLSNFISKQ